MARIHPTAIVSPRAELADGVEVGPYAVIEAGAVIGEGTTIGPYCHIHGSVRMGRHNRVASGVALGLAPQDLHYTGEPTGVEIGDENIIREYVTIHRGTGSGTVTRIGSRNMFMTCSHVGHNAVVGNHVVLVNGALLGGYAEVQDRAIVSGHCAVHQFCRVGRLALMMGLSGTSRDVPPFMVVADINQVAGFNRVGLKRAGFSSEAINAVREAFRWLYREGCPATVAVERIEKEFGHLPELMELAQFIRTSKRGICGRLGGHIRQRRRVDNGEIDLDLDMEEDM